MRAEDAVGLTGPAYEVDIERGKIREFARAMHAPLPEFVEGRRAIIPATFLATAPYGWGYTLERPRGTVFEELEHDFSVSLHGEEAFLFPGALPRAGDRLIAQGTLERVVRRAGARGGELTLLTLLTTYRDEAGALVAEQRSTSITAAETPGTGDWEAAIPDYAPSYPSRDVDAIFGTPDRLDWEALVEGEGPAPVTPPPLTLRDTVAFQGAEGEDDPMHYDQALARSVGYPSVFGLGMCQASMLAGQVASRLDPAAVRRFRARFVNVFWPGEQLRYGFVVARKLHDPESGHRVAELELTCSRASGEPIVRAWMTLDLG